MILTRTAAPVSWGSVALVVVPGLLFGISRAVSPLGVPAGLGFLLVALLALGALVGQRRLPVWGLLVLGMLTGWALQQIGFLLPAALTGGLFRLTLPAAMGQLIMAIPVWLAGIWLLWKHRPYWRDATWAVLLLAPAVVGASLLINANLLFDAGLVLLAVVLGLRLSRPYGSLAALFVLGVFSSLVLFDSDYYAGPMLRAQPFYPLYVIPLVWMVVSVAPLLLLRGRTRRGQALGLLAPVLVWGTARIAVPLLFRPDAHPPAVWLGDALLSACVLSVLALAFYLYSQPPPVATEVAPKEPLVARSAADPSASM